MGKGYGRPARVADLSSGDRGEWSELLASKIMVARAARSAALLEGTVRHDCEATVTIEAPARAVWAVVSDVTRVGEWSGECRGCDWVGGANAAVVGAQFRGRNRRGVARWSRLNQIFRSDPPNELVWRTMPAGVYPDSVEWTLRLTEEDGKTTVTESFHVVRLPKAMEIGIGLFMPQHLDRSKDLAADLGRLKGLVERGAAPAG